MTTAENVTELRRQGKTVEAYNLCRTLYAADRGEEAATTMFWTAADMLLLCLDNGNTAEAIRIFRALLRLKPALPSDEGKVNSMMIRLALRIASSGGGFAVTRYVGPIFPGEADWARTVSPDGWNSAPMAWRLLRQVGYELRKNGGTDNARSALPLIEEALKRNPADSDARSALAAANDILGEGALEAECPDSMAAHLTLGKWGEEMATLFLREKGYVILERDWRSGHRDIDIIASRDAELVFVEVKTRTSDFLFCPEHAIDDHKRHNINKAMWNYLRYKHLNCDYRFDVITVVGPIGSMPKICHYEDVCIKEPPRK